MSIPASNRRPTEDGLVVEAPQRPQTSTRRAVIAGLITFAAGLPVVVVSYLMLNSKAGSPQTSSAGGDAAGPEFIGETNYQSQAEGLEQFRGMMSDEDFEKTVGPAIRHERENPKILIGASADIDKLPDQVNRLCAPTITDAGLARLAARVSIRELDLDDNKNITDAGMQYVARIRGLESLGVSHTNLGDDGVAHLAGCSLTYFGAWYSQVGDRGLGVLAGISRLEQLQLKGCVNITDVGIAKLAKMPKLRILHISECPRVTDEGLRDYRAQSPAVKIIS